MYLFTQFVNCLVQELLYSLIQELSRTIFNVFYPLTATAQANSPIKRRRGIVRKISNIFD